LSIIFFLHYKVKVAKTDMKNQWNRIEHPDIKT
jgi:hypothetical protein